MMTLEEAIAHCLKRVEENKKEVEKIENKCSPPGVYNDDDYLTVCNCINCAEEHKQLAMWLMELKKRREGVDTYDEWHKTARAYLDDFGGGSDNDD